MTVKIEFEETYPTLRDSLVPESDFGPQPSLNLIILTSHGQNPNISVPIK